MQISPSKLVSLMFVGDNHFNSALYAVLGSAADDPAAVVTQDHADAIAAHLWALADDNKLDPEGAALLSMTPADLQYETARSINASAINAKRFFHAVGLHTPAAWLE